MKPTARTILRHSLLVPMALAVAAALAACAGESAGGGHGVTAAGSAGASTGSAGASAGNGAGAAAPAGQGSGGGTAANVPAAAKALICPPPRSAFGPPNAPGSAGQVIPARFSPVAVVQCRAAGAIAPVAGQLTYVRKEVAVADLQPLLAALQQPSAPRAGPGPTPGCPVLTLAVPELALIGRDGSVVYPRIPVTVCGAAIAPVTASLDALHWITVSTTGPQQAGQPQAGPAA